MTMGNDCPLNASLDGYRILGFKFLSFIRKEYAIQPSSYSNVRA